MSLQEQVQALTAQLQALQNQLSTQTPPAATVAPLPVPKPPKVATPTPFKGMHKDLDQFKVECGLYMAMRSTKFQDKKSQILFVLSYMKGGTAGPWATLSGEGPIPVRPGSVSTGIDPMHRGPASLEGPQSLLSQQSEQSLQGLTCD